MFMKMPNALPIRLFRPSIDQVAVDALSPSGFTTNPDVATDANGLMNSRRIDQLRRLVAATAGRLALGDGHAPLPDLLVALPGIAGADAARPAPRRSS